MSFNSSCSRSLSDSRLAILCLRWCVFEQHTLQAKPMHTLRSRSSRAHNVQLRTTGGEQLMRILKTLCGAAALVAFLAPGAHADEWNKRTYLTFSGPVQVPGVTLPAGTYTFELANPDTTRHVIRVSEKDSGKHVGLFMTIPNQRLESPSDNLIMFSERPAGSPQAIQAWFYPGDRVGEEFVYPKSQAMQIAKATKKGVLATEGGGVTSGSEADRMAS